MPELPEVRVVVKSLNDSTKDKKIKNVEVFLPKLLKNVSKKEFQDRLKNKIIKKVENRGKFIVFSLKNDLFVVSHLRMEGKYRTDDIKKRKHDHVIFTFTDGTKLIYNDVRQFGTYHLFDHDPNQEPPLSKIAKEPKDVDINELFSKMQKKRIAIKTAILDQTLIAGIGNIYADEILWKVKISPVKPANKITIKELKAIVKASQVIMDKSTELGGTTIRSYTSLNAKEGSFQNFLKVHGKNNEKCKRCGTIISKIKVNGRGTYYCRTCQKW